MGTITRSFANLITASGPSSVPALGTLTVNNIQFPATQVASANANTLDDYEEGTWTPNVGGNTTYGSRYGRYVKIGKQVSIQFLITISTLGTGSNNKLDGLPFTSDGGIGAVQTGGVSYWETLAVNTIFLSFYVESGQTTLQFVGKATSGTTVDNAIALFGNSAVVYGAATYYTT